MSIPARARAAGIVDWHAHDLREWADNKHRKTDDRPFGGGPGMVMMCQPVWDAVMAIEAMDERPAQRVLLTPQGRPLTQSLVEELAGDHADASQGGKTGTGRILLIAGHGAPPLRSIASHRDGSVLRA